MFQNATCGGGGGGWFLRLSYLRAGFVIYLIQKVPHSLTILVLNYCRLYMSRLPKNVQILGL